MQHGRNSEDTTVRPRFATRWLDREGLYFPALLLSALLAVLAVISRRPDALFNPQFFAEDGNIWFADAYNYGWLRALAMTHTGYFQTLPRLGAALALAVPLQYAPLVMNLIGLVLQIAPAVFLLSRRASNWAPLRIRTLMAAAYIALPNTSELNVSITEAQWHLGLLASLVVLSRPPASRIGAAFDVTVLMLCGLTGPFCIVLFPAAVIVGWVSRTRWRMAVAVLLGSSRMSTGHFSSEFGRPDARPHAAWRDFQSSLPHSGVPDLPGSAIGNEWRPPQGRSLHLFLCGGWNWIPSLLLRPRGLGMEAVRLRFRSDFCWFDDDTASQLYRASVGSARRRVGDAVLVLPHPGVCLVPALAGRCRAKQSNESVRRSLLADHVHSSACKLAT